MTPRILLASIVLLFSFAAFAQSLPAKFDPTADAAADIATATSAAKAQHQRVMVDVGGEWCPWCHILDRFVATNADVKKLVDDNDVWVKVNWSPQNRKESLLSRWPTLNGDPHLFVLDGEGRMVHSQDTSQLEAGNDYDKDKLLAFLRLHRQP
ncbi:MAG: thioredoxin family protein [Ramlibacter sp.]